MAKRGRKPTYDRYAVMKQICNDTATSSRSIVSILKGNQDYPGYTRFYEWLDEDPTLAEQYARAKADQADYMAEEMLDIADNGANDWMLTNENENAGYRANGENIQRSRLRVDTRKWLASKLKAKKYGEKLDLNHSGEIKTIRIKSNVSEE